MHQRPLSDVERSAANFCFGWRPIAQPERGRSATGLECSSFVRLLVANRASCPKGVADLLGHAALEDTVIHRQGRTRLTETSGAQVASSAS
jgi:hypothetical protein